MSSTHSPIQPFRSHVDAAALEDLARRLRTTRWPDGAQEAGWGLGVDLGYLRELADYWANAYDWRSREAELEQLPRFTQRVGGLDVHFVHARSKAQPALPLILCHGWPDSFWRYSKVIPLLVDPAGYGGDPADAFDVVVPDMPGFGFSQPPAGQALNASDVSLLWAELMSGLGYEQFGAAGGDIGGMVSRYLALDHPQRLVGVHRMDGGLPVFPGDPAQLTAEERDYQDRFRAWAAAEGAYAAIAQTKPQTIAAGLTDSPVGLAAWIIEKLRAWSDCGGELETSFTRDEILDNVTIYWLTGSIGSSMRMYAANATIAAAQNARRVEVPSGFSLFGGDIFHAPRAWLERTANVVYVSEPERGGHFAPFEQPEVYAAELRAFFRPYRHGVGEHG